MDRDIGWAGGAAVEGIGAGRMDARALEMSAVQSAVVRGGLMVNVCVRFGGERFGSPKPVYTRHVVAL